MYNKKHNYTKNRTDSMKFKNVEITEMKSRLRMLSEFIEDILLL